MPEVSGVDFLVQAHALVPSAKRILLVERDQKGYILTGTDLIRDGRLPTGWLLSRPPFHLETSVPGVFAAGDVRYGSVKRVASAVGEGTNTVQLLHQYLAEPLIGNDPAT